MPRRLSKNQLKKRFLLQINSQKEPFGCIANVHMLASNKKSSLIT